ncbi:hypothetical protein [Erwinia rhapontici]|uniref:hypothetical protein n=1 Tax=Erwinia rhapontici TaxID=55212 RepID=UPI00216A88A2|nr:hypothetical protein [Erwinia rhapontici]MCS3607947.1 hypothetical protein [Erwinia rhapontici]
MNYELLVNNFDDGDYCVVLIEASLLHQYLDDYHEVDEINYIRQHCTSAPKNDWFRQGNNQVGFIVPLIRINEEGDICIIDGRHRFFWMISQNISPIPVSLTLLTKRTLEDKGFILNNVSILDLPCNILPQAKAPVKIDVKEEAKMLMQKLIDKN